MKHGRGRQPPPVADPRRARPITIASAAQRKTNCDAEREPVPERRLDVAAASARSGGATRPRAPRTAPARPRRARSRSSRAASRCRSGRPPTRASSARRSARTAPSTTSCVDRVREPEEALDPAVVRARGAARAPGRARARRGAAGDTRAATSARAATRRAPRPRDDEPAATRRVTPAAARPVTRRLSARRSSPAAARPRPRAGSRAGTASVSEVRVRVHLRAVAQRVGREVAQAPRRRAA